MCPPSLSKVMFLMTLAHGEISTCHYRHKRYTVNDLPVDVLTQTGDRSHDTSSD